MFNYKSSEKKQSYDRNDEFEILKNKLSMMHTFNLRYRLRDVFSFPFISYIKACKKNNQPSFSFPIPTKAVYHHYLALSEINTLENSRLANAIRLELVSWLLNSIPLPNNCTPRIKLWDLYYCKNQTVSLSPGKYSSAEEYVCKFEACLLLCKILSYHTIDSKLLKFINQLNKARYSEEKVLVANFVSFEDIANCLKNRQLFKVEVEEAHFNLQPEYGLIKGTAIFLLLSLLVDIQQTHKLSYFDDQQISLILKNVHNSMFLAKTALFDKERRNPNVDEKYPHFLNFKQDMCTLINIESSSRIGRLIEMKDYLIMSENIEKFILLPIQDAFPTFHDQYLLYFRDENSNDNSLMDSNSDTSEEDNCDKVIDMTMSISDESSDDMLIHYNASKNPSTTENLQGEVQVHNKPKNK